MSDNDRQARACVIRMTILLSLELPLLALLLLCTRSVPYRYRSIAKAGLRVESVNMRSVSATVKSGGARSFVGKDFNDSGGWTAVLVRSERSPGLD
jgi:hypothetical protein